MHTELIKITDFFKIKDKYPIIDTRSPSEFQKGHIPGAINIPLFTDEERAVVGTTYKQIGKEEAVIEGLKIVGPKMADLAIAAKDAAGKEKTLIIYCWRGGMRSESIAWLFEKVGIKIYRIEKGYKAYRSYIREQFTKPSNIHILGGMTGSGKTELLEHMESLNLQVLNLEKIAHHKGSAFGMLGEKPQPTTEHFENLLYEKWKDFDLKKEIWIEDESKLIGIVAIPDPLFEQMRETTVIKIITSLKDRVERLVRDYGKFDKELIKNCILKIKKRLGPQNTTESLEALENGDLSRIAELTLNYYDKTYNYGLTKRSNCKIIDCYIEDSDTTAERVNKILDLI